MSTLLQELGLRALAAGAPPADDNTVIVVPGVSFRSIPTGLVYDRGTRLPLLSDRSWVGWVTGEVERRGFRWRLSFLNDWSVGRHSPRRGKLLVDSGQTSSREEALVRMLETSYLRACGQVQP